MFRIGGDDHAGGTQQAVTQFEATARCADDLPLGLVGRFLRNGIVEVGVELTCSRNFRHALIAEELVELFAHHVHADVNHRGGVLRGGHHSHFEIIDHRQEILEQALVGVADRFLALAGGSFAQVVHFRGSSEGEFLPFGHLRLELLPRIGLGLRFGGRIRGRERRILGIRGIRDGLRVVLLHEAYVYSGIGRGQPPLRSGNVRNLPMDGRSDRPRDFHECGTSPPKDEAIDRGILMMRETR